MDFTSAKELADAPLNLGVRTFIASCTNTKLLTEALKLEQARAGGPRLVRKAQLTDRLQELGTKPVAAAPPAPATAVNVAPKAAARKRAGPKEDTFMQAPTLKPEDIIREKVGAQAVPPKPTQAVRARNAATVIMQTILDGNVAQLTTILNAVVSGSYDVHELAVHLIEHGAQLSTVPKGQAPKAAPATGPVAKTVAIVQECVSNAVDLVITPAVMQVAGVPESWTKYSAPWHYLQGTAGRALMTLGYLTRTRDDHGAVHVTLVKLDSDEGRALLKSKQKADAKKTAAQA